MAEPKGLGVEINRVYKRLFNELNRADTLEKGVVEAILDRSYARQQETLRLLEEIRPYNDVQ